jgi:hypothetical protein
VSPSAEPFADAPRLSRAERALLELAPDHPARVHAMNDCGHCGAAGSALSFDLSTIRETVLAALGHGHAVTIHPHPTEWAIGLTIHPRAGECDCIPEAPSR